MSYRWLVIFYSSTWKLTLQVAIFSPTCSMYFSHRCINFFITPEKKLFLGVPSAGNAPTPSPLHHSQIFAFSKCPSETADSNVRVVWGSCKILNLNLQFILRVVAGTWRCIIIMETHFLISDSGAGKTGTLLSTYWCLFIVKCIYQWV